MEGARGYMGEGLVYWVFKPKDASGDLLSCLPSSLQKHQKS